MFPYASKAASVVPRDNTAFALANCPASSAAAVAASSGGVRLTARVATLKNRSSVSSRVKSAAPPLSSTKKPPARSTPPTDSNQELKGRRPARRGAPAMAPVLSPEWFPWRSVANMKKKSLPSAVAMLMLLVPLPRRCRVYIICLLYTSPSPRD